MAMAITHIIVRAWENGILRQLSASMREGDMTLHKRLTSLTAMSTTCHSRLRFLADRGLKQELSLAQKKF